MHSELGVVAHRQAVAYHSLQHWAVALVHHMAAVLADRIRKLVVVVVAVVSPDMVAVLLAVHCNPHCNSCTDTLVSVCDNFPCLCSLPNCSSVIPPVLVSLHDSFDIF